MNTSSARPFTFTRFFRICCSTIEILAIVGILLFVVMIPFVESGVAKGSQVAISKGSKDFAYTMHPHFGKDAAETEEPGSVSIGPFPLTGQTVKAKAAGTDVTIHLLEGMATFTGPEKSALALSAFKWPAIAAELAAMLAGLAYIDMVRRLLSSAEKGELFTDANVRALRWIGFAMIVFGLMRFGAWQILVARMNSVALPYFPDGSWAAIPTPSGKMTGVLSGLTFLLLAEVFREGLKFRKDSDLTI